MQCGDALHDLECSMGVSYAKHTLDANIVYFNYQIEVWWWQIIYNPLCLIITCTIKLVL